MLLSIYNFAESNHLGLSGLFGLIGVYALWRMRTKLNKERLNNVKLEKYIKDGLIDFQATIIRRQDKSLDDLEDELDKAQTKGKGDE